ncbi:hypothetical protein AGMMS49992_20320 [Clostridia bacterium]|nr:hypothetical protein AGMMS49992_20320 [Clostridia bacterium]
MFYVKETLSNSETVNLPITESNLFAICPDCGEILRIELKIETTVEGYDTANVSYMFNVNRKTRGKKRYPYAVYIETTLPDGKESDVSITNSNVYTLCPCCGEEEQFPFIDAFLSSINEQITEHHAPAKILQLEPDE